MGLMDSIFGTPYSGADGYADSPNEGGLLNNIGTWMKDPRNAAGLQAFGAAMAKAGAPRRGPSAGFAGGLSEALSGFTQGQQGFDQNEMAKLMQKLQMQKAQQDLNQKVDPLSYLSKIDVEKFTPASMAEFLATKNPSKLVARTKVEFAPNGTTIDPLNTPVGQNFGAPLKVDQGGKTSFVSPGTFAPLASFEKTQSPDSIASNQLGWANNRLAAENQNMPVIQSGPNGEVFSIDRRRGVGAPVMSASGVPLSKGEKPLTEYQGKSTGFGLRAMNSDEILSGLGTTGVEEVGVKRTMENIPIAGGLVGAAANASISPTAQKRDQAERDFTNAVLRQESGAAINNSEFENARRQYFPRVGDSPEVIKQKEKNRKIAIQGFSISAGPGAKNFKSQSGGYVETRTLPDGRTIGMKADGSKEIIQ